MNDIFGSMLVISPVLILLQLLAAVPWLLALDPLFFKPLLRKPLTYIYAAGVVVGGGAALFFFLGGTDPAVLSAWGRIYGSLLHLQLGVDFFVLVLGVMLLVWPRGGAVALAAFREGVRQPMFWLLTLAAFLLMLFSLIIPYFTFGEDYKMVRELCYAQIMLATVAFAVIAASTSISEEIEGRTAITLMSKPVSRRQFLLGKFVGIFLAALVMTVMLGWWLIWALLYKQWDSERFLQQNRLPDPAWVTAMVNQLASSGDAAGLLRGIGLWFHDAGAALPGLVIGSCQVMVILAVAVALATRVPMVVNIPICLAVYLLGHLTPVLTAVSADSYPLVHFLAQLFDTILPGLDHFDMSPAIVRDAPLPMGEFSLYTFNVALYAVMYTAIALLFGLILFEDRDLA